MNTATLNRSRNVKVVRPLKERPRRKRNIRKSTKRKLYRVAFYFAVLLICLYLGEGMGSSLLR